MTLAVNLAQGASNNVTFRNRIINGAMVIDQRNAGASFAQTDGAYNLDRWSGDSWSGSSTTGKYTVQQSSTAPTGFNFSLKVTSSAATSSATSDLYAIKQRIEGYNTADLGFGTANAKTITISFWVRSSATGTFGGALKNSAGNRAYAFTYSISAADTWEQKSITIAGDTSGTWVGATNGMGLAVYWQLQVGSSNATSAGSWATGDYYGATGCVNLLTSNGATFYITGVQLEAGTTASPFEYRQYGTEFSLCQRYYSVYQDFYFRTYQAALSYFGATMVLAVNMRATPTMTIVGTPSYANCSGMVVVSNQGTSAFLMYALVGALAGDSRFSCSGTSNYITASAEL